MAPDARNWYNERLNLISFRLQVRAHLLEHHPVRPINNSENVLAHDPAGSNSPNNSEHCGPEVAVILRAFAFAREAERLAGETACKDIDTSSPNAKVCCPYVCILFCIWEMVFEYFPTKRVDFAVECVRPSGPLRRKVEAADAGK